MVKNPSSLSLASCDAMTDVSDDGGESDHGRADSLPTQNRENRAERSVRVVG